MPSAAWNVRGDQCLQEVGPRMKDKDATKEKLRDQEEKSAESHQRSAAEQELKVAEKAREHQVEIETEIGVEE